MFLMRSKFTCISQEDFPNNGQDVAIQKGHM